MSWAKNLATSTTLFGALYLTLYQAAREYYAHLGITADQAGVSQQALAGGVLEFAVLYTVILLPGTLLAVVLVRWITSARRRNLEMGLDSRRSFVATADSAVRVMVPLGAVGILLLRFPPLITHNFMAVILLSLLGCTLGLGAGGLVGVVLYIGLIDWPRTLSRWSYFAVPAYVVQAGFDWLRGRDSPTALWVRRRGPWAAGVAVVTLLVFLLWGAADLAGGDVLRRGDSTRNIFDVSPLGRLAPPLPVLDLLGAHPVPVSPCLLDLGAGPTSSHLRAAVIVGHSGGRTYLLGVAGSGGFRHAATGHVVRFSVADSEVSAVDLDHPASPWHWNTSGLPVAAADNATC